ncbi:MULTISPECIES: S8 family serine peptidase [unclassified Meiothermus]|uniref:S8 family peptidase n=1 Tax=unclassified Meiothermus TaxID=370471 RepID=UPI000D7BCA74|nr:MULTISPECIES: S8 family serine peptidase [unclassified Meiothermus]PZA05981.1 peptidase S8 [Meiothermus sp. Pnk-1]RYM29118.1 peptidase S8 [Meiothermus sp. PNK-Is4]
MRKWLWIVLLLSACAPAGPTLTLSPGRAALGEEVEARLQGMSIEGARVFVAGAEAEVTLREGNRLRFRVPSVPGGPQPVRVVAGEREARGSLGVLGNVDRSRALLRLPLGQTPRLPAGFTLLRRDDLQGCGFALAELGYSGETLGKALEELEAQDPSYKADPESLWSLSSWGSEAIGAPLAQSRGHGGNGVRVAVLDTGVDGAVPQLPGYDFVEEDATPQDAFPGGHGTGAAGLVREVAPGAGILPVRVCDGSGVCRASRVVRGVCYVVANRQGPTVLNLSLGGDTPVEALKLALQAALNQGIPVAAAAGNQGNQGSPAHYPAALDLPGLVAVGALEKNLTPAPYSTRGAYVDLAAPGTALECVTPGGGLGTCTGTSFATPLVAGAMAVWLSAQPTLTPAQLQQNLEHHARPLPFAPQEVGKGMVDLSQAP